MNLNEMNRCRIHRTLPTLEVDLSEKTTIRTITEIFKIELYNKHSVTKILVANFQITISINNNLRSNFDDEPRIRRIYKMIVKGGKCFKKMKL